MQQSKKFWSSLFLFVFLSAIGIGLGSAVSKGIIHLYRSGMFVSWELLNSPIGFTRIADATPDTVWAQTVDDNLYYWNTYCESQENCNRWIEVKDISKELITSYKSSMTESNSCEGLSKQFSLLKEPPGAIVQCSFTKFDERIFPEKNSYYVVLTNGTIWVWRYTDLFVDKLLFIPLVCEFVGFILSLAIFVFLLIRKRDVVQRQLIIQTVRNIVLNILLLTAFSIGGIIVGFKVGYSIDFPSSESKPWRLITSSIKFSQIADISENIIWAQTLDSKLYSFEFCNGMNSATCNKWVETINIPSDAHKDDFQPMSKSQTCPQNDISPTTEPPGKVIECISIAQSTGSGYGNFYYALLEDGTIWYWSPNAGTDFPILSFFVCPFIGFLLFVIAGGFVIYLRMKKRK